MVAFQGFRMGFQLTRYQVTYGVSVIEFTNAMNENPMTRCTPVVRFYWRLRWSSLDSVCKAIIVFRQLVYG